VEEPPMIGEGQNLNTTVMKEGVVDLHSAHMEFENIQLKQQLGKHDGAPSFTPTLALNEPDTKAEDLTTTSLEDARVSVEKEDHCENVLMDQVKKETSKDDSTTSFSARLRLSKLDGQSPVP